MARDETPYPLTRSCFIIFPGPSCFLLRSLLLLSRGSLGEASRGYQLAGIPGRSISRFILRLLSFTSLLLPSGPLAPSSHEVRCNPENRSTQCPDKRNGIGERETRCKSGVMMGADDGFSEIPPVANQNLQTQAC
jgi:hypothetical protein